ncbi:MAG: hypothetical protein QNJ90_00685 [Planctomycetota bacterium]|nr:hypothetical protein [Planctomycetota bacterium]
MARPVRRHDSGFGFVEVMVGGAILAVAMLAYGSSMMSHRGLASEQTERSEAMISAQQFMERLRADDDWAGLYARCRLRLALSQTAIGSVPKLADGRRAWEPTVYFPGFQSRGEIHVLIDVPMTADKDSGSFILREDVTAPRFLLPMDLDGDGAIDGSAKDDAYRWLPVVVHFVYRAADGSSRELRLTSILRGNR